MHFTPNNVYHIYNRGNNKQLIFFNERNYSFFLKKVCANISPYCEILCWCLMPNHFHFMIYATENSCKERPSFGGKPMQELSYQIGILLSSYSQAINKQNGTIGSLFQQKTKSKCISDFDSFSQQEFNTEYLIKCMHYIHQNPLKAGLTETIDSWEYSSFGTFLGKEAIIPINKELIHSLSGYNESTFFKDSYDVLEPELINSFL